jgi:hypothetical protein
MAISKVKIFSRDLRKSDKNNFCTQKTFKSRIFERYSSVSQENTFLFELSSLECGMSFRISHREYTANRGINIPIRKRKRYTSIVQITASPKVIMSIFCMICPRALSIISQIAFDPAEIISCNSPSLCSISLENLTVLSFSIPAIKQPPRTSHQIL